MRAALVAFALLATICIVPARAQSTNNTAKYNYCSSVAAQQSGWNGDSQNPNSKAVARGGVFGAGTGALIGGVTGGNAGTGAAIGAAFGLIAGEARRSRGAKNVENQENAYYNALDACLQQASPAAEASPSEPPTATPCVYNGSPLFTSEFPCGRFFAFAVASIMETRRADCKNILANRRCDEIYRASAFAACSSGTSLTIESSPFHSASAKRRCWRSSDNPARPSSPQRYARERASS
jgi:Glycine zipper